MGDKKQFAFDGAWKPAADPATIGENDFYVLENLKPCPGGIQPVLGYSPINTTALTSRRPRNGFQLLTREDISHVFLRTDDGIIWENKGAVPSTSDFEATAWHTDTANALAGRFSEAPKFNMVYCNGLESLIYAGAEMDIGGAYLMDDAGFDGAENPKEYSSILNDNLQTTGHYISLGTQKFLVIFTARKPRGFKFYVKTANDTASTWTAKIYTGSWTSVSSPSDGTTAGGIALAQTGTVSFTSTVSNAIPFHYNGNYAFATLFELSAGSAEIYRISVDCAPQAFCNIWDGTPIALDMFQVYHASKWEDYTADISDVESYATDPIGAELDGLTTSSKIRIVSSVQLAGFLVKMAPQCVNALASVMTVKYYNGTAFTTTSASDWTQSPSGTTLGKGGYISWNPPAITAEVPIEFSGQHGFNYEITFSATLSGTHGDTDRDVVIDMMWGIPAQVEVPTYRFCVPFKNRLLGVCPTQLNQGNRIDYTPVNAPDVWNGVESSMDGLQSAFADTHEDLVAGITLFNRFGNTIFMVALLYTRTSTHILSGDGPEDFKVEKIAPSVGCPAWETLCIANIGFNMTQDVTRNVLLWVSNVGPMMFDGSLMSPVAGIENYFDNTKAECVNWAAIDKAWGRVDSSLVWHIGLPSGSGVTEVNTHLGYDLKNRERGWFKYSHGSSHVPRCGFEVKDTDGVNYLYGGIDNGKMVKMEYGHSWDGEAITYAVETGDRWHSGSVWAKSIIRALKLIARRGDTDLTVNVYGMLNTGKYTISDFEVLTGNDFEILEGYDFEILDISNDELKTTSFTVAASSSNRLYIGTVKGFSWNAKTLRLRFEVNNNAQDSSLTLLGYGLAMETGREEREEV